MSRDRDDPKTPGSAGAISVKGGNKDPRSFPFLSKKKKQKKGRGHGETLATASRETMGWREKMCGENGPRERGAPRPAFLFSCERFAKSRPVPETEHTPTAPLWFGGEKIGDQILGTGRKKEPHGRGAENTALVGRRLVG
jgi:hypothetical protein